MAGDRDSKPKGDRKRKFESARIQHGSKNKRGNMGRGSWSRQRADRRGNNMDESSKRQKLNEDGTEEQEQSSKQRKPSVLPKPFPEDEVAAEERRPKHKVAVLIGYSGTGYKGMQINWEEKTIEGDLFTAFVAAGAISKANANDPKKSSLVRCARTDKGVHAAGNVISLKLIIEDEDIIKKINDNLTPQIRVWNITRTVGSFSSYQACDSRWYEYFIPTHSFLPPHPSSVMAKRLRQRAEKAGAVEEFDARNKEVEGFWEETEEKYIKPILDELPEHIRRPVETALYESRVQDAAQVGREVEAEPDPEDEGEEETSSKRKQSQPKRTAENAEAVNQETSGGQKDESADGLSIDDKKAITAAVKRLKQAYNTAKRRWRIPAERLARIQPILHQFEGTHSFHYFTVDKTPTDPSAFRVIKSFKVDPPDPILIGGEGKWNPDEAESNNVAGNEASTNEQTEWLSLRIHGQSFMMHQIRKMVSAIVLTIRCGADPQVSIPLTFSQNLPTKDNTQAGDTEAALDPTHIPLITIPKAPGLGLLLLHPVFKNYNTSTAPKFGRDPITFETEEVKKKMDEFKFRQIYERMFREEAAQGIFEGFWGHVDESSLGGWMWLGSYKKDKVEQYFPVQKESYKQRRKREEEEARSTENVANSSDDDLMEESKNHEPEKNGADADNKGTESGQSTVSAS